MTPSASRALLLVLLGSGLPTPAATVDAPSCQGNAGCALPLGNLDPEGDDELSLLQVSAESEAWNPLLKLAKEAVEKKEMVDPMALLAADDTSFSMKKCVAEFIAMTLFVFIGCGSAMSIAKSEGSAWVLQVSLTFGIAITVLAYSIGHYSGGQINCAVTFGLVLSGKVTIVQGIGNLVAQLLGSILGAMILRIMYGDPLKGLDRTGGLGTNTVSEGWSPISALIGEIMGTFVLVYVVHETAINPANSENLLMAPLAIGFAVFLAHSVLIPVDGCSINPTRTFGPALVHAIDGKGAAEPLLQMWIFWVGPLLGAAAASGVYALMTAA